MNDNELLAIFTRSVDAEVASALVVKFRRAEAAKGFALPHGYAVVMLRHHMTDVSRQAERAERAAARAAARAVVAQAEAIEADKRAEEFVAAALQFDALQTLDVVSRLTAKQREALTMLRTVVLDGVTLQEAGRRFGLKPDAAWQRIFRLRAQLRPVAAALGFEALRVVALDNHLSPAGGAANYR